MNAIIPFQNPHNPKVEKPFIIATGDNCFNPSIFRWNQLTYCAWREQTDISVVWVAIMRSDYSILSKRKFSPDHWDLGETGFEDPRIFLWKNSLHLSISITNNQNCKMGFIEFNDKLEAKKISIFSNDSSLPQKNWQFFETTKDLHAVYLVNPHIVGILSNDKLDFSMGSGHLSWVEGEARGGSPPILIGDEYFAFFHSSCFGRYVAGFYAFEAKPPFRVTRWPNKPCLVADLNEWQSCAPWVVFPSGSIYEDGIWTLSFGWHDMKCCLIRYKHCELIQTLQKVDPKKKTITPKARFGLATVNKL